MSSEPLEPHHVPQQSRRDKLRVVNPSPLCLDGLQTCPNFSPLCDPSLLYAQRLNLGTNLMGFAGGMSFGDPQLSVQVNPTAVGDTNGGPYGYTSAHNCRRLLHDQSFHGHEQVAVYKPEPLSMAHQETTSGQSLSLSLSSHQSNPNLPLELNLQRYDPSVFSAIEMCTSSGHLGPFTGYASVLKGSRFLRPAQQLLEDLCDVGWGVYSERFSPDSWMLDPPVLEGLRGDEVGEQTGKKSRLLSMLDEVYKRYKQYYQQMQDVVASFASVSGLSTAAPLANLALKAMSKHFKCLKNVITDQMELPVTAKSHDKMNCDRDETRRFENPGKGLYGQGPFQSTGYNDQPVWRPQRGLPERAVTVLRAWLFEHFLHPYPTDTDKVMLAKQTGLSRNQVSNWFINARVRLWKPMVEEIHMLETHQGKKASKRDQQPANRLNDHLPTPCSDHCKNPTTSAHKSGELPLQCIREDLTATSRGSEGPLNSPYDNILHDHTHSGIGVSNAGGSGGVSLTLGLYQNGVGLPEAYPKNAARRLGLDAHGEEYVVSGFAEHNRQLGRDILGGQLLHDFVG